MKTSFIRGFDTHCFYRILSHQILSNEGLGEGAGSGPDENPEGLDKGLTRMLTRILTKVSKVKQAAYV